MTTGKPWTPEEIKIICTVYANMLKLEQAGKKFNKALARRTTTPKLDGRSGGSYEMKMCNISAALDAQGYPWIIGYKPRSGYQRSLKVAIVEACKLAGVDMRAQP
jgi:hypothetical protein